MQLEFRAWNKSINKMVIDSPISMGSIIRDNVKNQTNFNQDGIIGEEYIVMQYIGLNDANGKKIYEGDILQSDKSCIHIVRYEDSLAAFVVDIRMDEPQYADYGMLSQQWIDKYNKIVIGNIYKNANLLSGKNEH